MSPATHPPCLPIERRVDAVRMQAIGQVWGQRATTRLSVPYPGFVCTLVSLAPGASRWMGKKTSGAKPLQIKNLLYQIIFKSNYLQSFYHSIYEHLVMLTFNQIVIFRLSFHAIFLKDSQPEQSHPHGNRWKVFGSSPG